MPRRFPRPDTVIYRKILPQVEWNGDGFCIPPRRALWLLSQPGGRKFAGKNRSKSVYNAGWGEGRRWSRPAV